MVIEKSLVILKYVKAVISRIPERKKTRDVKSEVGNLFDK